MNTERAYRAALVLGAQEGRYFLARYYAYRIELRRLGRQNPLEELRLCNGKPNFKKPTDAVVQKTLAEAKSQAGEGRVHPFLGVASILALSQRRPGGSLYALVGAGIAGKGCALDRIEWDQRRVERVALNLPCPGRVSMAAGRDGLYFAGFGGESGRFSVSWSTLDEAKWTTVKEAVFSP